MTTLRALFYADVRSVANQLREIRQSPGRSLVWICFAIFVAGFIGLRIDNTFHRGHLSRSLAGSASILDIMACLAIAAFGVVVAFGGRFAGLFAHPAEARFIIDSPAEPFVATLYIQARQIVRGGTRQALGILYMAVIYLPQTLQAGSFVRDLALIVLTFTLIAAVPLARQSLPTRLEPLAFAAGGVCLAAAAAVVLRDAALALAAPGSSAVALARRLPGWHPGAIFTAGARDGDTAMFVIVACTGALFAYVAHTARDAYPELYELSMKRIARTERLRGRPFSWAARAPQTALSARAAAGEPPPGVAIFIWRAWTEYRRTSSPRGAVFEAAACVIAGYALARIAHGAPAERLAAFASPLVNVAFIVAMMRSAALATELRRPLFWLSGATLFERLCALGVAQGWRLIGWFGLGGIGLAAGGADATTVVAVLLTGPCGVLLAGAVGFASYALLPSAVDQRGPLVFARVLLGYVLIVPPIAAGVTAGVSEHAALVGFAVASFTTVLEAAVLVGFASWRLDRMSISLR